MLELARSLVDETEYDWTRVRAPIAPAAGKPRDDALLLPEACRAVSGPFEGNAFQKDALPSNPAAHARRIGRQIACDQISFH
jgi:hypothetical protein